MAGAVLWRRWTGWRHLLIQSASAESTSTRTCGATLTTGSTCSCRSTSTGQFSGTTQGFYQDCFLQPSVSHLSMFGTAPWTLFSYGASSISPGSHWRALPGRLEELKGGARLSRGGCLLRWFVDCTLCSPLLFSSCPASQTSTSSAAPRLGISSSKGSCFKLGRSDAQPYSSFSTAAHRRQLR